MYHVIIELIHCCDLICFSTIKQKTNHVCACILASSIVEWRAAFGLTASLIWLYIEILRLLAIFNND